MSTSGASTVNATDSQRPDFQVPQPRPGSRRKLRWARYLPAAFFIVSVLVLSVVFANVVQTNTEDAYRAAFQLEANHLFLLLQGKVEQNLAILRNLESFFMASISVERQEFRDFLANPLRMQPGIQAVEWIPRVSEQERVSFEAAAQADGVTGYTIREHDASGQLVAASPRAEYFPVYYVEPGAENEAVLGFDMASESTRKRILDVARDRGSLVVSPLTRLIQETGQDRGIVAVRPIYRNEMPRQSVAERQAALEGFVLGAFRLPELFNTGLQQTDFPNLQYELWDISEPQAELLYRSAGLQNPSTDEAVFSMQLDTRVWQLRVSPGVGGLPGTSWEFLVILFGGLGITALLLFYLVGSIRHTNRLEAARGALRQSEEEFRSFSDRSQVGFYRTTPDGRILMANPALVQMLGFHTFEELKQQNVNAVGLEDPQQRAQFKQKIETDGEVRGLEATWHRPDGIPLFVRENARAVWDPSGRILYYEGTAEDITEQKNATEALRESEERFRSLFELAHDAILLLDEEGRFFDCNPQALQLFGTPRDRLIGKFPWQFSPPSQADGQGSQEEARHHIAAAWEGQPQSFEWQHQRTDGTVLSAEVSLNRVDTGRHRWLQAIVRDVSERKRLQQEAEKGRLDFLFTVSHELKTPLFLMATAQQMVHALPPDEREQRFIELEEVWIRNLSRLRLLINNLVDSQRGQVSGIHLYRTPTDLTALVARVAADTEILAEQKRLDLEIHLQPIPALLVDEEAIERVVYNLLTNAIKFSDSKQKVEVRLRPEGNQVVLEVEDQGRGIAADVLPNLFQPFRRSASADKTVVPGTGLGLYVCKILVESHGGSISLESEERRGTTVTVRLPLS
jgi:PAS domain S-box-containing protein